MKLPKLNLKDLKGSKGQIVIGIVGIIVTIILYEAAKRSSGSNASTSGQQTPLQDQLGGSGDVTTASNGSTDPVAAAIQLAQIQAQQAVQVATVEAENSGTISFSQNDTYSINGSSTSTKGSTSSGSGFLGILGLGFLGGSGSKGNTNTTNQTASITGGTPISFSGSGLNASEINSLTQLITGLNQSQNEQTLLQETVGVNSAAQNTASGSHH